MDHFLFETHCGLFGDDIVYTKVVCENDTCLPAGDPVSDQL